MNIGPKAVGARKALYGGLLVLLVTLNVVRFAGGRRDADAPESPAREGIVEVSVERLHLNADGEANPYYGEMQRDLFTVKRSEPAPVTNPAAVAAAPKGPPPPSPAEIAERAARADLEKFRLFGVVIKKGQPRAFLNRDNENYAVGVGDTIDGKYRVEEITGQKAVLRDSATRLQHEVPLVGETG